MAKYRKKPVVIEAWRYMGGGDFSDAPEWVRKAVLETTIYIEGLPGVWRNVKIKTMEDDHHVRPGAWIIQGVTGELYACAPGIFEQTYEEVES